MNEASREIYRSIIEEAAADGAQGVILGCTEIGLLLRQEDVSLPLFNTATLHAQAAVAFALGEGMP